MAATQIKNGFNGGSDDQLLVNPDGSINVNGGGGGGSNASVGPVGSTAPGSATEVGGVDPSGNLVPVSTDSTGAINVNVISTTPSFPQETLSTYSEVGAVASGATATVLTYTVPTGLTLYLNKVVVSSDGIAQMDLEFNGTTNSRKRLSYTLFNETFDYSLNGNIGGFKLVAGTIITVIGINLSPGSIANFNATLQGVLQ